VQQRFCCTENLFLLFLDAAPYIKGAAADPTFPIPGRNSGVIIAGAILTEEPVKWGEKETGCRHQRGKAIREDGR
jgi:hypothetical protein